MEPQIPPGLTRETTIRRSADGRWYHDGEPIRHPGVRKAFDRWVDRADDGRYILKNDVNWAYVEIEGAPLVVERADPQPSGITLELSDDRTEPLEVDSLRQDGDGYLYCDVRGGRMTARFSRHAMFDLAPVVDEDATGIYLRVGDRRVVPPVDPDPVH